ncbi:hypothetical protein BKH41_08675 [Helicobacter sp. 12S02232-10]|uniref:hypothetical protein n=1 Tax=Helicobacter sp. 12S02232-10 TaxID=1476197 RepID=UPI000BA6EE67|nr:hypothetical protein [Helicobacter sp. 12S02232-10]PAF46720.1 hypothetical protein BKH41_08675 [Helicobacter sp. 12S02232-10]
MEKFCIEVQNPENISNTTPSYCIFEKDGGIIGSGKGCYWELQDENGSINERHVAIAFIEDCFTIVPIEASDIFYNHSFSRLGYGHHVSINMGDTFQIGDLILTIKPAKAVVSNAKNTNSILKDIDQQTELDAIKITDKGKEENFTLKEENDKKELLDNADILEIFPQQENEPKAPFNAIGLEELIKSEQISVKALLEVIAKTIDNRKNNLRFSKLPIPQESLLSIGDFEHIISNFPMIQSHTVLNVVVLSLIIKELSNPILEDIEENYLEKQLSGLLMSAANGDCSMIEKLLLRALEKYLYPKDFNAY